MSETKTKKALAMGLGLVASSVALADAPGGNPYANPYSYGEQNDFIKEQVQCRPDEVAENVKRLNGLQIVTVSGLQLQLPPSSGYCYGLPCPEQIEAAKQENCARADKLAALVDLAEALD